jgi:hypothetical protein
MNIDNLASQFELDELKSFRDKLNIAEKNYNDALAWADAYRQGVSSWNDGVTVKNPITGAGIWYAGNALATVQNNVSAWTKKANDFKLQYDTAQKAVSSYLDALVARYGGAQNVSVEQYVKEFNKPIETKTETGEKGSGLTIALIITAIVYIFISRNK